MNITIPFLVCELAALSLVAQWTASARDPHVRQAIRTLYTSALPFTFRSAMARGPLWAGVVALFGLLFALPRGVAGWAAIPVFDAFALALLISHGRPMWLLPRWLHDEIQTGRVELARPVGRDWAYFWVLFLLALVMNVAVPVMLLP